MRGERLVRKVELYFFRGEVDVGEDDDPRVRLFENLRPPASFASRIEAFAAAHAEAFE